MVKKLYSNQIDNPPGESNKMFSIEAVVQGEVCGLGQDFNKKSAEKQLQKKLVSI